MRVWKKRKEKKREEKPEASTRHNKIVKQYVRKKLTKLANEQEERDKKRREEYRKYKKRLQEQARQYRERLAMKQEPVALESVVPEPVPLAPEPMASKQLPPVPLAPEPMASKQLPPVPLAPEPMASKQLPQLAPPEPVPLAPEQVVQTQEESTSGESKQLPKFVKMLIEQGKTPEKAWELYSIGNMMAQNQRKIINKKKQEENDDLSGRTFQLSEEEKRQAKILHERDNKGFLQRMFKIFNGGKTRKKKRRIRKNKTKKKRRRTKKKRRKRRKRNTIKKIRLNILKSKKCSKCYDSVVLKYKKCVKKCQKRKTRKRK